MKAPEIRRLSVQHDRAALQAAVAAVMAGDPPPFDVEGDREEGEHLTHLMLALRVLDRVDGGLAHKDAFREVMGAVRGVMTDAD